jgi:hypothetical protein
MLLNALFPVEKGLPAPALEECYVAPLVNSIDCKCESALKRDFIPFLSNYAHSSSATCMFHPL